MIPTSVRVTILVLATSCAAGRAMALSCLSTDARVPVFYRTDLMTGLPTMSTSTSMVAPLGRSISSGMFFAAKPTAGVCPTGTNAILDLHNTVTDEHFYTADPTVAAGKPTPPWTQTTLDACIFDGEAGMDEDPTQQACDVPLFRDEFSLPKTRKYYRTSVHDHHDCTSPAAGVACTGTYIGRVYPPPVPYVMRVYNEPYVARTSGTTIVKMHGGLNEVTNPPLTLPFPAANPFMFFGQPQTLVKVSTNGILTFNPPVDDATDATPSNTQIYAEGPPRNLIAGWWTTSTWTDYINSDKDTDYRYTTESDPHGQRFIVQWGSQTWAPFDGDVTHVPHTARDMQIHLVHPDPGMGADRIEIHYGGYVQYPPYVREKATIGVMAPDLTQFKTGQSQVGAQCSPNCGGPTDTGDWHQDQVIAFLPQPSGYLVSEVTDNVWFQPLLDGYADNVTKTCKAMMPCSEADWVELGFTFEFDGQKFDRVGVSTAGVLMFGQLPPAGPGITPSPIPPVSGLVGNVIAPWWDDLVVDTTALPQPVGILSQQFDSKQPDGKQITIEWRGLVHNPAVAGTDTSHRQMQVTLYQAGNKIAFHYADSGWKAPNKTFDHPSVGIIGAPPLGIGSVPSAITYRLVNCAKDCSEAQRDRVWPAPNSDRPGGWPRFTKFLFTPDSAPSIDWHLIYRSYFMPDDLAGGTPSQGFCGNCHHQFDVPEQQLYDALFAQFSLPSAETCLRTLPSPDAAGSGPLLSMIGTSNVVDYINSQLVNPDATAVSWMTEPGGAFNSGIAHMPWFNWCNSHQQDSQFTEPSFNPVNMLDEAKSRIRRWLLLGTP